MRSIFILICLPVLFFSCRKVQDKKYDQQTLALNIEQTKTGNLFSWTVVNTSDFIRYELHASNQPIPDPMPNQVVTSKLIFVSQSQDRASLLDSLFVNSDQKYFRVFAFLQNSILTSRTIENPAGIFSFENSQPSNAARLLTIPNTNTVVIVTNDILLGSRVSIVDVRKMEFITKEKKLLVAQNSFELGHYNNETVLFSYSKDVLTIYQLPSLDILYTANFSLKSISYNFLLKNNLLYYTSQSGVSSQYEFRSIDINTLQTVEPWTVHPSEFIRPSSSNPSYALFVNAGTIAIFYFDPITNKVTTKSNVSSTDINNSCGILSQKEYISAANGKLFDKSLALVQTFNLGSIYVPQPIMQMDHSGNYWMHKWLSSTDNEQTQEVSIYKVSNPLPIKTVTLLRPWQTFIDESYLYSVYFANENSNNFNLVFLKTPFK